MGRKNRFHGHEKNISNFTGKKIEFFHGHRFRFHCWIFWKYSRELFRGFFDFFTTTVFVTAIFSVFSTFLQGMISFFKGKNTVVSGRVFGRKKFEKY